MPVWAAKIPRHSHAIKSHKHRHANKNKEETRVISRCSSTVKHRCITTTDRPSTRSNNLNKWGCRMRGCQVIERVLRTVFNAHHQRPWARFSFIASHPKFRYRRVVSSRYMRPRCSRKGRPGRPKHREAQSGKTSYLRATWKRAGLGRVRAHTIHLYSDLDVVFGWMRGA